MFISISLISHGRSLQRSIALVQCVKYFTEPNSASRVTCSNLAPRYPSAFPEERKALLRSLTRLRRAGQSEARDSVLLAAIPGEL